jgi:MoaA/NifB/PqqE/SkfB family radical SAM enzyme
MGNLRQGKLLGIYRNSELYDVLNDRSDRQHHCRVCEFRNYCGGCRARADAYFGRLDAGDPGCVFNQKHWERIVAAGGAGRPADLSPTRA